MRIAYFITGLGLGGAEVVTIGIANQMVKRGNDVMLVWLNGENSHSAIIDPAIECVPLNMTKTPWGIAIAMSNAARVLKKFSPDVVHGNMIHTNILLRLLRVFVKMPLLISTEHSKNIEGYIRMLSYRYTDFLSDINTNVSQEAVDFFIEAKAFKVSNSLTIYNGINLERFIKSSSSRTTIRNKYGIGEDDFLFINVGRLTEAKDHNNLLEAFANVGKGKLIIVGQGELHEQLQFKIAELNLMSDVILAGAHSNVEDFYNSADCFVLSSAWEGFGIVIAEAMACELPVIATNAGGCAEVVDNSKYIVPTNDPMALSKKMCEVYLMLKSEREILGKQNRELTRRFDIVEICNTWEKLYQTGCNSKSLKK